MVFRWGRCFSEVKTMSTFLNLSDEVQVHLELVGPEGFEP